MSSNTIESTKTDLADTCSSLPDEIKKSAYDRLTDGNNDDSEAIIIQVPGYEVKMNICSFIYHPKNKSYCLYAISKEKSFQFAAIMSKIYCRSL